MKVIFSNSAARQWRKLPREIQKRIKNKITFFLNSLHPLEFAKDIKDKELGEYCFRIGEYRLLFDVREHNIIIVRVGHRKDIYK